MELMRALALTFRKASDLTEAISTPIDGSPARATAPDALAEFRHAQDLVVTLDDGIELNVLARFSNMRDVFLPIEGEFDPQLLGALQVAIVGAEYVLLDGYRRLAFLGNRELPTIIYSQCESLEDALTLRMRLNFANANVLTVWSVYCMLTERVMPLIKSRNTNTGGRGITSNDKHNTLQMALDYWLDDCKGVSKPKATYTAFKSARSLHNMRDELPDAVVAALVDGTLTIAKAYSRFIYVPTILPSFELNAYLNTIRNASIQELKKNMKNFSFWGPTGCGKSRMLAHCAGQLVEARPLTRVTVFTYGGDMANLLQEEGLEFKHVDLESSADPGEDFLARLRSARADDVNEDLFIMDDCLSILNKPVFETIEGKAAMNGMRHKLLTVFTSVQVYSQVAKSARTNFCGAGISFVFEDANYMQDESREIFAKPLKRIQETFAKLPKPYWCLVSIGNEGVVRMYTVGLENRTSDDEALPAAAVVSPVTPNTISTVDSLANRFEKVAKVSDCKVDLPTDPVLAPVSAPVIDQVADTTAPVPSTRGDAEVPTPPTPEKKPIEVFSPANIDKKKKRLLEICKGTGSWGKAYGTVMDRLDPEQLYQVISIDIERKYNPTICLSLLDWDYKQYPPDTFSAACIGCPCSVHSRFQYSHKNDPGFAEKQEAGFKLSEKLWTRAWEIVQYFDLEFYVFENPASPCTVWEQSWMQPILAANRTVDVFYCKYGYHYPKKTTFMYGPESFDLRLEEECTSKSRCNAFFKGKHLESVGRTGSLQQRYSVPQPLCIDVLLQGFGRADLCLLKPEKKANALGVFGATVNSDSQLCDQTYDTPVEFTSFILSYVKDKLASVNGSVIWDAMAGNDAIVDVFTKAGFNAVGTEIKRSKEWVDLSVEDRKLYLKGKLDDVKMEFDFHYAKPPDDLGALVLNPPFNIRSLRLSIKRAYDLNVPLFLLFPAAQFWTAMSPTKPEDLERIRILNDEMYIHQIIMPKPRKFSGDERAADVPVNWFILQRTDNKQDVNEFVTPERWAEHMKQFEKNEKGVEKKKG